MRETVRIRGIAGSLRTDSFNRALLQEAFRLLPEGAELETLEIGDLPHYNQDLEGALPEPVQRFRASLTGADALLIATPEYNYSIPGVLKNAIDWASRAPEALAGKPVAVMGASGGSFGTVRAQLHLRQILTALDMRPVNKPELLVRQAFEAFDASGRLLDDTAREILRTLLHKLVEEAHLVRLQRECVPALG